MYDEYGEVMIYSDGYVFLRKEKVHASSSRNGWSCPFKHVGGSFVCTEYGCRDRIASFIGQKGTEDGGSREMVVLWVRKIREVWVDPWAKATDIIWARMVRAVSSRG